VARPFDGDGRPVLVDAPRGSPPFPVAAVVEEDDTYHVLSAAPVVVPVREHPLRVLDAAHGTRPSPPGTVVVREGTPLRLLAVVHSLDRDPSWREAWVVRAWAAVLVEAERRRLHAIATPPLGTIHGTLDRDRSLALLDGALDRVRPIALERVWIVSRSI
jgi:hypothetical protein